MLETLDYMLAVSTIHRPFYISIGISTLPKQHTTYSCLVYLLVCLFGLSLRNHRPMNWLVITLGSLGKNLGSTDLK